MARVGRVLWGAVALATLVWVVVLLAWDEAPFTLTFDDAYYYFGIARNLADGHGSTFDQLNLTNGYHPLWMAICVLPFRLGLDDLAAARVLLVVQVLVGWGVTLALVTAIVSRSVDDWRGHARAHARAATALLATVVLLLALNPFVVKAVVNGLESGIVVTIYALILFVAVRRFGSSDGSDTADGSWVVGTTHRWRLGMGALLALAFLGRTDAVFLIGCVSLWCLAEAWMARRDGTPVLSLIGDLGELFGPPTVVIATYLLLNQALFDTPVQVSGLVKRAPLDATTIVLFALFLAAAAAIGRHAFRRAHGNGRKPSRLARFPRTATFAARTGWFGSFIVIVIGYYNVLQTQQWLWYYCPAVLYLVTLFLLAVADMIDAALRLAPADREPKRALMPVAAIFVVPLVIGLLIQIGSFTDPTLRSIQTANRDAGTWIRANTPDDAVLASWDAGVVGYFAHRRVINIDGVVNSHAYYDAMRTGTVPRFLRCQSLGYVVNHGTEVNGEDPDIRRLIADVYGPTAERVASVIERVPFRYSGTANTGGFETSGPRDLVVHVYAIPPGDRGPRAADTCR